jgi:hypothetical protein
MVISRKSIYFTFASLIFCLTSHPHSSLAGEPILDRNCRYHERSREVFIKIPPQNQGSVFSTLFFKVKNNKHILQVWKFPDNSGILCLFIPDSQLPIKINNAQLIQDKLIEKVEKDPGNINHFIVSIKGKKNENILRTSYRLNLSNPKQPKVSRMIIVYKK